MNPIEKVLKRTILSALVAGLVVISAAEAQRSAPIVRPENGDQNVDRASGGKCRPRAHNPSIYNPHDDVRPGNNNHSSLACALLHAKPGGEVIIHAKRGKDFLPSFKVKKPNLYIRAASNKVIIGQQADAPCVLVDPPGRNFEEITTTLDGFTFVAAPGAQAPCIDVRNGRLRLINSRIVMTDAEGLAINIEDTAFLEFTGRNNGVDGIFGPTLPPAARKANGIEAAFDVESVALTGVRLQGLNRALLSRANQNTLNAASFVDNNIALQIDDDAIIPSRSPSLNIVTGKFIGNGDAVLLQAGDSGLIAQDPDFQYVESFSGPIKIGIADFDPVLFLNNDRAIKFDLAYPENDFSISNAEFAKNKDYALGLSLPEGSLASLQNVSFNRNGRAIDLQDALNGTLRISDGSSFLGANGGLEIFGEGVFDAALSKATGKQAIFILGEDWNGDFSLSVASSASMQIIAYEQTARACQLNPRASRDRTRFEKIVASMDRTITINGAPYSAAFSADGSLSSGDLREIQAQLCD